MNLYNQNYPLHMQQTQYQANLNQPMANAEGDDDVEDAEPVEGDNEPREMNDWEACHSGAPAYYWQQLTCLFWVNPINYEGWVYSQS